MQLFLLLLAIAALFVIIECAPLGSTHTTPSAIFKLSAGSIQIAEGLWFNNSTVTETGYGDHQLSAQTRNCDESTIENRWNEAAPLVEDCWRLHNNIVGSGWWSISGLRGQARLASYGTCAFGAEMDDGEGHAYIGNEDIRAVLARSIAWFHWNGGGGDKVGTRGWMNCEPSRARGTVEWGIYHT